LNHRRPRSVSTRMCVDHGRTRICSGSPITVAPESDTRSRIHEPESAHQLASETMAEKHSLMALSYCSHACHCACDHMLAVCVDRASESVLPRWLLKRGAPG